MTLNEVLKNIGAPDTHELITELWDESAAVYPSETLHFLTDAAITEYWTVCGFEGTPPAGLLETARRIREDEALSRFSWHCFWRLYRGPEIFDTRKLPQLEKLFGDRWGEIYLLVALAAFPEVQKRHKELGLPEHLAAETCEQVHGMCGNFMRGHEGRLGIQLRQLQWLRNFVKRMLIRLGRFEYFWHKFPGEVEMYRQEKTEQVIALIADGTELSKEGLNARDPDMPCEWTATLERNDTEVSGYPVSPLGFVVRKKIRLPLKDWRCVVQKGSPVLGLHIPAGGKMTPEVARTSLQTAPEFFKKYLPDYPVDAIVCSSWMFNTQLPEFLPAESNLVRFQKEQYLYPLSGGPKCGLWFLFQTDHVDPKTTKADTSIQRAFLDFVGKGNLLRNGGMFILPQDLKHFGTQHYRTKMNINALS